MQQHRALILRSNRFLGSSLVDKGLVSTADLEAANERFMQSIQSADLKSASILTPLTFELKALDEAKLIDHLVDENEIGLVDLRHVKMQSLKDWGVDLSLCWATSTVPFDKMGDAYLLATCYYLSAPVVKCWEDLLGSNILWYATTMSSLSNGLEQLEDIQAEEEAAESE
ncbi:MAG: hypothetical protein ACPGKS_03360 [Coraliomargarita sp.]